MAYKTNSQPEEALDISIPLTAGPLASEISTSKSNASTAARAVEILLHKDLGFHQPTKAQRAAMLVGFAMRGQVLYGAAFDVVRLARPVELDKPEAIAENLNAITVYEVKSTNRKSMKADLKGYFFNLTTAELLVAQNLKERFRFAFVNILTEEFQDLDLAGIYKRAKAIYPAWHIKF